MTKETEWKKARLGRITASELDGVMSASGKIIDGNIDYVRHKRFERRHCFSYPVSAKAMDIGHEQEPYAIAWFRENYPEMPIVYAQECDIIPIWAVDWAKFSSSPDAFSHDESIVLEIKTVVSNTNSEFYADEYTSYEEKRASVLKEHGNQLAGQFLSNDKVQEIWLLKYIYQHDDVDEDRDNPLAAWRGKLFKFKREDFELESIKERIILFDKFIDSDYDARELKSGKIVLENGEIKKIE